MGKQKITVRITVWYAMFLIAISVVLMLSLVYINSNNVKYNAQSRLVEELVNLRDQIEIDGKDFLLDPQLEFETADAFISVCDEKGDLVMGARPLKVKKFPELKDRECQEIEDYQADRWFVYDSTFEIEGKTYWLRGIMQDDTSSAAGLVSYKFFFLLLPLLVLLAIIGGWTITKRGFQPIREIISISDEIQEDADLSRRIPMGDTHDEVYELSESINGMFDKLEGDMEREKQFSSDVSHELRTPLAIIQAQSEYAMENPDEAGPAVATINKQAKRMSSLVSKLLMLSRSDSGRLQLDKEEIDFSEVLTDIAEQQQMIVEDKDIIISTTIEEDVKIVADEGMLIRVILNLIDNAVKYGKNPGGSIHLSLEKNEGFAICKVTDDGPGIPEEYQDKIFQRFYQVDGAREDGASSGLGLSMVLSLTRAMGGQVSLNSKPGKGATFELKFKAV